MSSIQASQALAKLDKAALLIAEAKTLDEGFMLKALFKAGEIEARRTKAIEVEKKAVEYKFWTMNKLGEILDTMKKNGQRRVVGRPQNTDSEVTISGAKTLQQLKISPKMSSRYQKFYKMPEEEKMKVINHAVRRIERREEAKKKEPVADMPTNWQVAKVLSVAERIETYRSHYPNHPRFMTNSEGRYDRIYGMWHLGMSSMSNDEHYGAYPPTLAERILALFTDCKTIIHLFAGSIQAKPPRVITFDISPKYKPTICDDVANITNHASYFNAGRLLVMADPYYEQSDFDRMRQNPINKKKVLDDLASICPSGTFLTWLDTAPVMFNAKVWEEIGLIGMRIGSAQTRYRGLQIFQKR